MGTSKKGVTDMASERTKLERGKEYQIESRMMVGHELQNFDRKSFVDSLGLRNLVQAPPIEIMVNKVAYYANGNARPWLASVIDDELLETAGNLEFFVCKAMHDPDGPWYLAPIENSEEDEEIEIVLKEKP